MAMVIMLPIGLWLRLHIQIPMARRNIQIHAFLTWELYDVIRELEKVINGEESLYVSEFLEPYLKFSFMKVGENIGIGISFMYDTTDGIWKDRRLAESFTVEAAKDILEELKMLSKKYPIKESAKK